MATSPYFNHYQFQPAQALIEDLGVEAAQQWGLDVAYLKRSHIHIDKLFFEDPLSKFEDVRYVEMYPKTFFGYGQLSDMMSKFGGYSMPDTIEFDVMRKRFAQEFPDLERPMEGDLIYLSMTNGLFEIKYVEHEDSFYQQGSLQYFTIKCERFKYSSETFNTGVAEIDSIEDKWSLAISSKNTVDVEDGFTLQLEGGDDVTTEEVFPILDADITLENGNDLTEESGDVVTSSEPDPFIPTVQNELFETQSLEIIDFSETNPFGKF